LDGLLLSADQLNAAMGVTGIAFEYDDTYMFDDTYVPDLACRPLMGPLDATAYAGSGWTGFREQRFGAPGGIDAPIVDQGVVLFPSPAAADAFFNASAQHWPACRRFTRGGDTVINVGPISNNNGMLSYTRTPADDNWICSRALTVAESVVVDVMVCSVSKPDVQSSSAANIARQIAAKVPNR
jgi:hypothetical protein